MKHWATRFSVYTSVHHVAIGMATKYMDETFKPWIMPRRADRNDILQAKQDAWADLYRVNWSRDWHPLQRYYIIILLWIRPLGPGIEHHDGIPAWRDVDEVDDPI